MELNVRKKFYKKMKSRCFTNLEGFFSTIVNILKELNTNEILYEKRELLTVLLIPELIHGKLMSKTL